MIGLAISAWAFTNITLLMANAQLIIGALLFGKLIQKIDQANLKAIQAANKGQTSQVVTFQRIHEITA